MEVKDKFTFEFIPDYIFVALNLNDITNDIHESYLYKINVNIYNRFLYEDPQYKGIKKLDTNKIKQYLIEHRFNVQSYPYTEDKLYNMCSITVATSTFYKIV